MPSTEEIIRDPRWLPHRLDASGANMQFVRLERESHREVTFLEEQYYKNRFPVVTLAVREVAACAAQLDTPAAPMRFIFHSSMAVSTLAVRLFDMPGVSMGLKEPIILNEIANLKRTGRPVRPILSLLMRLFARPFGAGEAVVIKPGNVANTLIPDLLAVDPHARALVLYAPLQTFLRSIAKKGMWGRIVYRRLYALLQRDQQLDAGFSEADVFEQTDLQIAAMAWLNHHAQFAALSSLLVDRMLASDSEVFLTRKRETLEALSQHFRLPFDADAVLAGPLFSQHSKELGRAFDSDQRRKEHDATDAAYGEEIGMVFEWAQNVARHCGVPMAIVPSLIVSVAG